MRSRYANPRTDDPLSVSSSAEGIAPNATPVIPGDVTEAIDDFNLKVAELDVC